MAVYLSPIGNGAQYFTTGGLPLNGGLLYTYQAGTTSPQATYTTSAGTIANANPIQLGTDGRPPNEIWLTGGLSYKFVLTDSVGVPIPAAAYDNISSDGGALRSDLAASTGSSLVGFKQPGTGAATRTAQDKLRERVSVLDYGAKGDGTTDDTTAIQNAITAVRTLVNGVLYFPATTASYKVTAPLTITGPITIQGDGANASQIISSGMSSGQFMLDFNCVSTDNVEYIKISGITIRSLNGSPTAVRLKNVAYVTASDVQLYNVYNGIVIDGTRCFTHKYDNVAGYTIGNQTIGFASTFAGGGQFVFNGSTFAGAIGVAVPSGAITDSLDFFGCNFEQCTSNSLFVGGTVNGLTISGGRTEGCSGIDFVIRPFGATEYVGGFNVGGVVFGSSNAAASSRILLGGDSGKVRGFKICGNSVVHGTDSYAAKMVTLNGDGESGVIAGNYIRGTTAGGAGVVSGQRAGVVIFSNENLTGKLPEYWGTADWGVDQGTWTPTDASGASLTFTAAAGRYTKIGRMVMWQAFVTYPATANAANAEIGGLPYAVGGQTGNSGYTGARMDMTNLGTDVGILQGTATTTHLTLNNRLTGAALTNATVSGKYLYLSGAYSM